MSIETKLFEGTWEEAINHAGDIPRDKFVQIFSVEKEHKENEEDELGGKTLADLFEGRIGVLSFEPSDLSERAEEYLAHGFGQLPDSHRTQP